MKLEYQINSLKVPNFSVHIFGYVTWYPYVSGSKTTNKRFNLLF